MYVITGATGQTGAVVAETLLQAKIPVRVVVRDAAKGAAWQARGAEIAVADLSDAAALAEAFQGASGAYILNPPVYRSDDMFADARRVCAAVREASTLAHLPKLVVLSSVGAQLPEKTGNIFTTHILENELKNAAPSVAFVRCAWFMENWQSLMRVAREQGVLPSFLTPPERAIPMVSSLDIGRTCAEVLRENWDGARVIELHGPREYSPNDVAAAFSSALGREVKTAPIPEAGWREAMAPMGMSDHAISTWIEMLQGFNSGYMTFEGAHEARRGTVSMEEAARGFAAQSIDF